MTQETKILLGLGIITLLILLGGILFMAKTPKLELLPALESNQAKLLVRTNSTKSTSKQAKVQIVEFADFQCPSCALVYPMLKSLRAEFGEKVSFVYRHFPLPQHKNAKLAAAVAESAGKQGKFWEMYDLLFSKQTEWSESNKAEEVFINYAKELKLNIEKFKADLVSKDILDHIAQDMSDANSLGINQTPTFFINSSQISKMPSQEQLRDKINELLKD